MLDERGEALEVEPQGGLLMFGRVTDKDRLVRQMERWLRDIRPGAEGYLGSTGGVTPDGRGILLACFESAAAAQANSARSEQDVWWSDTEACFDGPVTFTESDDVEDVGEGSSVAAGFVQIMKGTGDRARVAEMDRLFEEHMSDFRPEILGLRRIWTGPQSYVEAAYFTSEEEAREGERKPLPPAFAEHMGDFDDMTAGVEFLDLREPMLSTA
jgi:hypothetical protein